MREADTTTSAKSKTDKQLIATTGTWVTTGFLLLAALIVFAVAMSGTWSTDVMRILMSLGISLSVLAGTAATISVQLALARGARHRADRRAVDLLAGLRGTLEDTLQDHKDAWAGELLDTRMALLGAIAAVDERRRVAVDAIEENTRRRIDELAKRADERHEAVLDSVAGLTEKIEQVESRVQESLTAAIERANDAAKWKKIVNELKESFGPNGSVISIDDRRNGQAHPGQGA